MRKASAPRVVLAVALAGGIGVVALRLLAQPRSAQERPGQSTPAPTGSTNNGTPVPTGIATEYGKTVLTPTGAIDYTYMPDGWANWAGPRGDDWSKWRTA